MAVSFEVTDVHQRERFTAGGGKVTYYEVTLMTENGATGTLRIKSKNYNKAALPGLLQDFADNLELPFSS